MYRRGRKEQRRTSGVEIDGEQRCEMQRCRDRKRVPYPGVMEISVRTDPDRFCVLL